MDINGEQTGFIESLIGLQNGSLNIDFVALDAVLIAGMLISWFALFMALLAVRNVKRQAASSYRLYEKIVHDLQIAGSGAIGMGQRIIALEKKISSEGIVRDDNSIKQPDLEKHYPDTLKVPSQAKLQSVSKKPGKSELEDQPLKAMFAENIPLVALNKNLVAQEKVDESQQNVESSENRMDEKKTVLQKIEDPFEIAKGLLQRGIAQAEVAKRCGLSLSETALMAMVLKNKNSVGASRLAS